MVTDWRGMAAWQRGSEAVRQRGRRGKGGMLV
jgi:hypothetical protein